MIYAGPTVFQVEGLKVFGFMDGYPAGEILPEGVVIREVNGFKVDSLEAFKNVTSMIRPGDVVSLKTDGGLFEISAVESQDSDGRGYLGVYVHEEMSLRWGGLNQFAPVFGVMLRLFFWIAFFNINIALVNLLPIVPFDGGRMFKEFLGVLRISDVNVLRIVYASVIAGVLLLLVNILPLLGMLKNHVLGL